MRQKFLNRGTIERAVGLRTGTMNGRPLGAVQQFEVDSGTVGSHTHQAIERIDFPNEMPFPNSTDRWVAGHRANGRQILRQE
ncbi:hypothetical protein AA0488_0285 [Kozakia baliensis NRIC 0488]|nr:hypothetical protein AA0488_0285 [Kozakia baliensis NRIC 0488]